MLIVTLKLLVRRKIEIVKREGKIIGLLRKITPILIIELLRKIP
jgi:hypothetical protein